MDLMLYTKKEIENANIKYLPIFELAEKYNIILILNNHPANIPDGILRHVSKRDRYYLTDGACLIKKRLNNIRQSHMQQWD